MKKLFKLLTIGLITCTALWSYTPQSSISSIRTLLENIHAGKTGFENTTIITNTLNGGDHSTPGNDATYHFNYNGRTYIVYPTMNQYMMSDPVLTSGTHYNHLEWWFEFSLQNGNKADVLMNFQPVAAAGAGNTAATDIVVLYDGNTYQGKITIPSDAPTEIQSFDISFADGTTGALTYNPHDYSFSVALD